MTVWRATVAIRMYPIFTSCMMCDCGVVLYVVRCMLGGFIVCDDTPCMTPDCPFEDRVRFWCYAWDVTAGLCMVYTAVFA